MSKGIAVRTILTLIVGIVVVGLVVFLVYTYLLTPAIPEQDCRAMAISWCTTCKTVDWTSGPAPSETLQECARTYFSEIPEPERGCEGKENWCSTFIPT
jgi:hypothetical protein